MTVREQTQQQEAQYLSARAVLSQRTKGRERPEEEDPIRTPFQRDRDRIIHCKSFRRLMHKTQVFLRPEDTSIICKACGWWKGWKMAAGD